MRLVFTESAWEDYLWFQEKVRLLVHGQAQYIKSVQMDVFAYA